MSVDTDDYWPLILEYGSKFSYLVDKVPSTTHYFLTSFHRNCIAEPDLIKFVDNWVDRMDENIDEMVSEEIVMDKKVSKVNLHLPVLNDDDMNSSIDIFTELYDEEMTEQQSQDIQPRPMSFPLSRPIYVDDDISPRVGIIPSTKSNTTSSSSYFPEERYASFPVAKPLPIIDSSRDSGLVNPIRKLEKLLLGQQSSSSTQQIPRMTLSIAETQQEPINSDEVDSLEVVLMKQPNFKDLERVVSLNQTFNIFDPLIPIRTSSAICYDFSEAINSGDRWRVADLIQSFTHPRVLFRSRNGSTFNVTGQLKVIEYFHKLMASYPDLVMIVKEAKTRSANGSRIIRSKVFFNGTMLGQGRKLGTSQSTLAVADETVTSQSSSSSTINVATNSSVHLDISKLHRVTTIVITTLYLDPSNRVVVFDDQITRVT
jgi:hypothetical protein